MSHFIHIYCWLDDHSTLLLCYIGFTLALFVKLQPKATWVEQFELVSFPTYDVLSRDVTDSESESDGIRHFFRNPKSDGYLKSDRIGFEIFVSV